MFQSSWIPTLQDHSVTTRKTYNVFLCLSWDDLLFIYCLFRCYVDTLMGYTITICTWCSILKFMDALCFPMSKFWSWFICSLKPPPPQSEIDLLCICRAERQHKHWLGVHNMYRSQHTQILQVRLEYKIWEISYLTRLWEIKVRITGNCRCKGIVWKSAPPLLHIILLQIPQQSKKEYIYTHCSAKKDDCQSICLIACFFTRLLYTD